MKNWKYIEGAKTGNANTGDFTNLINRALRVAREKPEKANRMNEIIKFLKSAFHLPSERWQYHIDRLDKEISSAENKKTGNEDLKSYSEVLEKAKRELEKVKEKEKSADSIKSKEEWASARREIEDKIKYYQSRIGNEDKTGAEEFFKQLSDDVKEREKKDDADIEKVGNFKTGKSALKPGDRVQSYGVQGTVRKVEGENSDNIYGEPIIEVEWDNGTVKKVGEHYLRKIGNKVGNKTYKVKESSGHDGGYDYGYIVVDESNRSVGRTFSTRSEAEEYIRDLYKKEKVGNATPNYRYKDFLITNPEGHEYIVFLKDGRTVGYRGTTSKAQAEDWCDWHDPKTGKSIGNKVGNEASDDKFAYVMREFDEGKLKTPDGKVVTDPAQAKAIAYSESKKTENGLARARKAMNAWNSERKIEPVGKYREFIRDLKNAIMLDVAAVTYNNVDEQTLKSWVEQAKKEGFGSAIKGVQGKKVILDVY